MPFHDALISSTAADRAYLLSSPIIQRTLAGGITREQYIAFLTQAFHHVRHTVPLMMAVGARIGTQLPWLRKEILHYLEEEEGHDAWILDDIEASGGDPLAAEASLPAVATDAMIAYAYDTVQRRNPIGFFGMVHVLEGTSVSLALTAADRIQSALGLPTRAFRYLRSHGQLDQEHIHHLAGILNRLDSPADRDAVTQCARAMFWLYGNVFRGLDSMAAPLDQPARKIA